MIPENTDTLQMADCPSATCSAEVAERLYTLLEYYFEYAPTTYGMTREAYDATSEGKRTKEALEAYRKETGAEDTYAHSMFRQNSSVSTQK
jgi:hypothetical protein